MTGRTRLPWRVLPEPKKCCADAVSTSSFPSSCPQTSPLRVATSSATNVNGLTSGAASLVMLWHRNCFKLILLSVFTVRNVVDSSTTSRLRASSRSAVAMREVAARRPIAREASPSGFGEPLVRTTHRAAPVNPSTTRETPSRVPGRISPGPHECYCLTRFGVLEHDPARALE